MVGHHYNGAVFVFEGPLSAGLDVEDADLTLLGSEADSYLGTTTRILTDVNGDATNDLAVDSARPSGTLLVFYDPLSHADGLAEDEADYTVSATAGISAAMGDHNGDGYGDIVALDGSYSAFWLNIYDGSSTGLGTTPVATVTIDVLLRTVVMPPATLRVLASLSRSARGPP